MFTTSHEDFPIVDLLGETEIVREFIRHHSQRLGPLGTQAREKRLRVVGFYLAISWRVSGHTATSLASYMNIDASLAGLLKSGYLEPIARHGLLTKDLLERYLSAVGANREILDILWNYLEKGEL